MVLGAQAHTALGVCVLHAGQQCNEGRKKWTVMIWGVQVFVDRLRFFDHGRMSFLFSEGDAEICSCFKNIPLKNGPTFRALADCQNYLASQRR